MLNFELIQEYGTDSRAFFEQLVARLDQELMEVCYAIKGINVKSGNLVGPYQLGLLTTDDTILSQVQKVCLDISIDLRDKEDIRGLFISCIRCTYDQVDKYGIRVWL